MQIIKNNSISGKVKFIISGFYYLSAMQVLLNAAQMRLADQFTIKSKSITSIELMESASEAFVACFLKYENNLTARISIFCGHGNNGGDGLAIARLLNQFGFKNIKVFIAGFGSEPSRDFEENFKKIQQTTVEIVEIDPLVNQPISSTDLIIDALLGSGLNKPLHGPMELLVKAINSLSAKVYAVDVPTGFSGYGENVSPYNGIKAFKTITFQRPKINFFFPESIAATETFEVVDIGLNEDYIQEQESAFQLVDRLDVIEILKPRVNFTHKGTYGHALIIAGAAETMGAGMLCAAACLKTGAGLVTASIPTSGLTALNSEWPEIMFLSRTEWSLMDKNAPYNAIAIGPGLGINKVTEELIASVIESNSAIVMDADALNLLAKHPEWLANLPKNCILTPHLKEFDRLFGNHTSWSERLVTARKEAMANNIVIVLKNQFTFICLPTGVVKINPTGNPAMAQGGMGDVLTGCIAGLLAQGYSTSDSAVVACYIHGAAGDFLAKKQYVVSAGQVAKQISITIKDIIG